jgi:hypothetical protein
VAGWSMLEDVCTHTTPPNGRPSRMASMDAFVKGYINRVSTDQGVPRAGRAQRVDSTLATAVTLVKGNDVLYS